MSAKEEAFKNEFQFASSSIVAHIVRGVLVGIVVGCIVSSFRFLIEHIFHFVQGDVDSTILFVCDAVGVWSDRTDCWLPHSHQSGYQGIRNSSSRSRAQGSFGGELVGYLVEEVYSRCLGHRKWLDAWS